MLQPAQTDGGTGEHCYFPFRISDFVFGIHKALAIPGAVPGIRLEQKVTGICLKKLPPTKDEFSEQQFRKVIDILFWVFVSVCNSFLISGKKMAQLPA